MTLQEAIEARHSVRAYKNEPLTEDVVKVLEEQIVLLNREGNLHMQLILNEPKAFQGTMAKYGKFRNANNYIVMAGKKAEDLDERIGANAVLSPGTLLMPKTIVRRLELIEQDPL
jgi:nitroreductase